MSQLSEKAIEASRLVAGLINRRRAGRRERFYYFEDNAGDDDDDVNNDSDDDVDMGGGFDDFGEADIYFLRQRFWKHDGDEDENDTVTVARKCLISRHDTRQFSSS